MAAGKISVEKFVDINEKKVLFYTTPFITDKDGNNCVNALSLSENGIVYFPAFFSAEDLTAHYTANNLVPGVVVKGNLAQVLRAMDSHPMLKDWGVVINPDSPESIGIPPNIRVRPKCLRD